MEGFGGVPMKKQITPKEKIGFLLVNLGSIPVQALINTYLLIFYTDIIGINPALVGSLFLIARFVDAIGDPIIGLLVDRFPNTKFGKYTSLLIIGSILATINFALLWFGPLLLQQYKVTVVIITYLSFGITFDLMDIPLNSLLPVMSDDYHDRNILSSIKGISFSAGSMILNTLSPLLIAHFSGVTGYIYLITIASVTVMIFSIIGANLIKEYNIVKNKDTYDIKMLIRVLKIRPVFVLFFSVLCCSISLFLYQSSIIYYVRYILNDVKILSAANMFGLAGALIGGFALPKLAQKFKKTQIYLAAMMAMILILSFQIFNYKVVGLFFLVTFIRQLSVSVITISQYSLSADNVGYIIKKMEINSAGAISSLNSLAMKLSLGIASAIQGFVLANTGYVANQAQSGSAIFGIVFVTFILPIIFYMAGFATFKIAYKRPNRITVYDSKYKKIKEVREVRRVP